MKLEQWVHKSSKYKSIEYTNPHVRQQSFLGGEVISRLPLYHTPT